MSDYIFEIVESIVNKTAKTEGEAKKFLKSFLDKNNLSEIDLELKELIEIAVYYTDISTNFLSNTKFIRCFNEEGCLINYKPKKIKIDAGKKKSDFELVQRLQSQIEDRFADWDLKCLKHTTGVRINKKGVTFCSIKQLEYRDDILYGIFCFKSWKDKKKIIELLKELNIRCLQSSTTPLIKYNQVLFIIESIIDKGYENRS